jgi:hypothetical protein
MTTRDLGGGIRNAQLSHDLEDLVVCIFLGMVGGLLIDSTLWIARRFPIA